MEAFKRQVVGFVFDETKRHVVLIRKDHPEWMAGKLNGVGGSVEADEGARAAMTREFEEETGVLIAKDRWRLFNHLTTDHGTDLFIFACATRGSSELAVLRSPTSEVVDIFPVSEIVAGEFETLPNVPWLVAMAHYSIVHQEIYGVTVEVVRVR